MYYMMQVTLRSLSERTFIQSSIASMQQPCSITRYATSTVARTNDAICGCASRLFTVPTPPRDPVLLYDKGVILCRHVSPRAYNRPINVMWWCDVSMADTILAPPCNSKIAFIHWDPLTLTFDLCGTECELVEAVLKWTNNITLTCPVELLITRRQRKE